MDSFLQMDRGHPFYRIISNMNPNTFNIIISILLSIDLASTALSSDRRKPLFEDDEDTDKVFPEGFDFSFPGDSNTNFKRNIAVLSGGRKLPFDRAEIHPLSTTAVLSDEDEDYEHDVRGDHWRKAMVEAPLYLCRPLERTDSNAAVSAKERSKSTNSPLHMFKIFKGSFNRPPSSKQTSPTGSTSSESEVFFEDALNMNSDFTFTDTTTVISARSDSSGSTGDTVFEMSTERPISRFYSSQCSRFASEESVQINPRISRFSRFLSVGLGPSATAVPLPEPSQLPNIQIDAIFGSQADLNKANAVLKALYSGPGDILTPVRDQSYDMIAKMLPLSRFELSRNLFKDRIVHDLDGKNFAALIGQAQSYLTSKFSDELLAQVEELKLKTSRNALKVHEIELLELREVAFLKESARSNVMCSIGKGSTIDLSNIYKIAEYNLRVIFTPRDIFYYPGMLKLSIFFNLEFDPSVSNDFFDQFIRTFYSGVYGPRRQDLFYITRIQDIPEADIPDGMLVRSGELMEGIEVLKSLIEDARSLEQAEQVEELTGALKNLEGEYAVLNNEIQAIREMFLDPLKRSRLRLPYTNRQHCYNELTPIPKTVEDVLEATQMILGTYWADMGLRSGQLSEMYEEIYSQENLNYLQSFFMDIFSIQGIQYLFKTFVADFKYDQRLRNHSASFLYAAFIETMRLSKRGPQYMKVDDLIKEMQKMFAFFDDLKSNFSDRLDKIHEKSEDVANMDIV